MKYLIYLVLVWITFGPVCRAEESGRQPVNIFVLRTAEQLQSPHILTYRVAEWEQMRGRWIPFDLGYYDTGYGKDQLWIAGAGGVVTARPRLHWEQEVYFAQEAGPQSKNARSLWLWQEFNLHLGGRVTAQIAAYPVLPLDRAQAWGFSIDRAKAEWNFRSHWRAGVGLSADGCAGQGWVNEPFFTVTRHTPVGSFETWLQSTPGGGQVQLRYVLVRGER